MQQAARAQVPSPFVWLARRELSGAQVAVSATVVMALVAWLSIVVSGGLGVFFGLCFVLTSLSAALAAHLRALFVPGVLPPLLMLGLLVVVANVSPDAIAAPGLLEDAGTTQRVIAGVVDHATALLVGHLLALGFVVARILLTAEPVGPDDRELRTAAR